jgi:hypothetical protein
MCCRPPGRLPRGRRRLRCLAQLLLLLLPLPPLHPKRCKGAGAWTPRRRPGGRAAAPAAGAPGPRGRRPARERRRRRGWSGPRSASHGRCARYLYTQPTTRRSPGRRRPAGPARNPGRRGRRHLKAAARRGRPSRGRGCRRGPSRTVAACLWWISALEVRALLWLLLDQLLDISDCLSQ